MPQTAALTFALESDEGGFVFHHGVDGEFLVILGGDDGHGRLVGSVLNRHVLHNFHL